MLRIFDPSSVFLTVTRPTSQPGYWNVCKPIKIIHFSSSPKPWEAPDKKGELELIWWQHFMAAQMGDMGIDLSAMGF